MARIASDAGMSIRKARDVIRDLSAIGLIEVRQSSGRTTNEYQIRFSSNPAQRAELKGAEPGTACRVKRVQPGTTRISTRHNTSFNPAHCADKEDLEQIKNKGAPSVPTVWDIWIGVAGEKKRSFLGNQIREFGEDEVAKAVAVVSTKRPADPSQYLVGILRKTKTPEIRRVANDY